MTAPKKFTFTKRQSDFLKPNLPDYMAALYGDSSEENCAKFIDRMYALFKKEYDVPDIRKEAVMLVGFSIHRCI